MADPAPIRPDEPASIRWPIHRQLLVTMVSVVLLASVSATAITAFWSARRVRNEQVANLRRVADALGQSPYPKTGSVLKQVKGLSGAEFVLIGDDGKLRQSTLPAEQPGLDNLINLTKAAGDNPDDSQQIISLGKRDYLVDHIVVGGRYQPDERATLWILYPEDQLMARVFQAVYPALIAGVVATAIAVAAATWLARRLARPMSLLAARTAAIAQGDFSSTLPPGRRNDELRDLAESINRMAVQLADYERQVRHQERLKTLGQLGASMAHQLRNAATGGRMAIELHRRGCPKTDDDESLDVALRQLRLMESYLRQFLSIGEAEPAAPQQVNTALLVDEVLGLVRPSFVHSGIELRFTPPETPILINGDPESLRQLITNLVLNAADAAGGAGEDGAGVSPGMGGTGVSPVQPEHGQDARATRPPRVSVEIVSESGGGAIRVRDNGPGLDPQVREQLFESFVTTKPDGFGIGLYVARQIAERHGGRLHWSREGDETCFTFEFPLAGDNTDL